MRKIIDDKGMLFGKINIFDLLFILIGLGVIIYCVYGWGKIEGTKRCSAFIKRECQPICAAQIKAYEQSCDNYKAQVVDGCRKIVSEQQEEIAGLKMKKGKRKMNERVWISVKKRHWERLNESAKRNKRILNEEIDRTIEHWLLINLGDDSDDTGIEAKAR